VPQQEPNGTWMAATLNLYTDAYPMYTLNRMMVGDK